MNQRPILISAITVCLALTLVPAQGFGLRQNGGLVSALQAQKSVVHIKAETGGVFQDKPVAVKHPTQGMVVMQVVQPVYHKRDGTGIIVSSSGLVATNAHIVNGANRITVTLADQSEHEATPILIGLEHDLAFLEIKSAKPLPAVDLSDQREIQLRTEVYSIGGSRFLRNTVSGGTIKGLGVSRSHHISGQQVVGLIEINFKVYQGDSGTPILDASGNLLGLVMGGNQKTHTTFAIPVGTIRAYLEKYNSEKKSHIMSSPTDSGPMTPIGDLASRDPRRTD